MIFLLACSPEPEPAPVRETDATLVALEAPRLLRRMSLDLRGVLPTVEELDRVEADPTQLGAIRDEYLEDPRFEERLIDVLAKQWQTEVETFIVYYFEFPEFADDEHNEYPYERSIADEPLRVIARIAAEDQPWEQIVLADWTMANETMAQIFPLEWENGQTGWQVTHYTDGRPAGGVLATNGLWWRYYTTLQNLNRGRAAAISKLLLCEDFLSRPISLSGNVAAGSSGDLSNAIRENPYCQSCHSTIDPLAANLFGFIVTVEQSGDEMVTYHPEREHYGIDALGVEPSYFGWPTGGLAQLGLAISEDPRFWRCSAERAAEAFWQRPINNQDFDRVEGLRQSLVDTHSYKSLVRDVTDSAVYRAGGTTADAPVSQQDREKVLRLMDPALIHSMLKDLTGFEWVFRGFEQLKSDEYGYRILGGGIDGVYNTRTLDVASVTWSLMMRRAAEGAALAVVESDIYGGDKKLFQSVTPDTRPEDPAFAAEVELVYWRLFARHPTQAQIDDLSQLWLDVETMSTPSTAWTALLAVLLRDPEFVSY